MNKFLKFRMFYRSVDNVLTLNTDVFLRNLLPVRFQASIKDSDFGFTRSVEGQRHLSNSLAQ